MGEKRITSLVTWWVLIAYQKLTFFLEFTSNIYFAFAFFVKEIIESLTLTVFIWQS